MIKNYFKTAWRNILKNRFYTLVNLTGLTIGLTVSLLILLWVNDELSYDRFNTNAANIYQINSQIGTGSSTQVWGNTQPPLVDHAIKEVPGVQNAVRIITNRNYSIFRYQNKILEVGENGVYFVDPSIFKMFDFKLLKGDVNRPFPNDRSIIITETTAKNYFGDADPIGKVLVADNKDNYTVAGVMADFPENSTIKADMFFSIELKRKQPPVGGSAKSMDEEWNNYYATTFMQLQPGVQPQTVMDKLTQTSLKHLSGPEDSKLKYLAQPLANIHLYRPDGNSSGMQTVRVFVIVAVLILLIACINYVNLSTARAMLRSKEVSVRKIIGAEKKQLFMQFLIETLLFFFIAVILSFVLIYLLMPLYNDISGKQMHFNLLDSGVWKVLGTTIAAILLAASIYPALLLSSFKPVNALRGKLTLGLGNATFRKVLVVCQFVFSIGLITGTLIINGQLKYIRQKDLGYDKSYVFTFPMRSMQQNFEAIRAQLLTKPGILDVTSSNDNIISANNTTSDDSWDGKDPNTSFLVHPITVDRYFLNFFKLKMVEGTGFTGITSDSTHFILNETAARESGVKDPVGKPFMVNFIKGTIIGVVKDFHFASLRQKIEPAVFIYKRSCRRMLIRTTGKDAANTVATVQQNWASYNTGFPFTYNFIDEFYDKLYRTDMRAGTLFSIFTAIAIIISCLGLLGLATYTAQVKVKEIGIRKVLGASVSSITVMLSRDFLALVAWSILIAAPISWFAMNKWLQDFAYRTPIEWWVFVLAGASALLIAFITISSQAIKAALANPVRSLRSE
jgi:putative ABC transport system permease protein